MAQYAYTFVSGDTVTPTKLNNARSISNIVNADVSATAAIAGTKISPNFGSQNIVTSGSASSVGGVGVSFTVNRASENNVPGEFVSIKSRGSQSARSVVASADNVMLIRAYAFDGSANIETARIAASVDGTPSANDMPGRLTFSTTAAGGSFLTEHMRINSAGNVGIGTISPNAAALLTLTSTTKGFLPPRMTTAQRDAISTPPAGLMIYNTTTNKLNVRTASSWEAVTSA
jgi:hypothetical protein